MGRCLRLCLRLVGNTHSGKHIDLNYGPDWSTVHCPPDTRKHCEVSYTDASMAWFQEKRNKIWSDSVHQTGRIPVRWFRGGQSHRCLISVDQFSWLGFWWNVSRSALENVSAPRPGSETKQKSITDNERMVLSVPKVSLSDIYIDHTKGQR